jgi:hypothetical protein
MHDHERTSGGLLTTIVVGLVCLLLSLGGGVGYVMYQRQQQELTRMRFDYQIQNELLRASKLGGDGEVSELFDLAEVPQPEALAEAKPPHVVTVKMDAGGKLLVDDQAMTTEELRTLLVVEKIQRPEGVAVEIHAQSQTPLRSYLAVSTACREADVRETTTIGAPEASP